MGLIANILRPRNAVSTGSMALAPYGSSNTYPNANYQSTVRAYLGNEIVSAGLNLLAKSAAEPHIIGRRYRRAKAQVRTQAKLLNAHGIPNRPGAKLIDAMLVQNGYWEEVESHPLIDLLNKPNPYTSRGQMWAMVVLDIYLAGNSYLFKARYIDGLLKGAVAELYRLRPDRMRPIAGDMSKGEPLIKAYEYSAGTNRVTIPVEDVIHFKTRNPLDPFLGVPVIMSLMPRVDIDTYMRRFLSTFFERGGAGVGAIFNVKGKMDQATKDGIRERFRRMFGGGVLDILVTSADEATYTPLGLNRGLRDALPKEIDAVNEARMGMVMGIPGSVLGLLIGYETSSYANQRQAWQIFWDITMAPMLSDFDDVLNLSLVPEFGGVDEVCFDLSDIHALQEDEDAFQERARKNVDAGLWTIEEGRLKTGVSASPEDGQHLLLPTRSTLVPTPIEDMVPENPPPLAQPMQPAALIMEAVQMIAASKAEALIEAPRRGRPSIEDDDGARAIWDEASRLKGQYPSMTWEQVAARVGVVDRTLRKYRSIFEDE